jgi:hypothetical protein
MSRLRLIDYLIDGITLIGNTLPVKVDELGERDAADTASISTMSRSRK